jgi:hypothetical protein
MKFEENVHTQSVRLYFIAATKRSRAERVNAFSSHNKV